MKFAVGQFAPSPDWNENSTSIRRFASQAVQDGAGVLVLPECTMVLARQVEGDLNDYARDYWPLFEAVLADTAREHGLSIIAGGYEPAKTRPFNTLLGVGPDGSILARYRKIHLYDAFHYQESARVAHGELSPQIITIGGLTVGLVNCYDLRFPEHCRALADKGADVITVSAAWAAGPLKEDHWTTLLRARAIENTCWVVASGVSNATCIGQSMIIDPLGVVRAGVGETHSGMTTADVSLARIAEARSVLPSLAHRRLGLAAPHSPIGQGDA